MRIVDFEGFQGLRPPYVDSDHRGAGLRNRLEGLGKRAGGLEKELETLDAATRDVESFFIYMLLKEMRKTVPETRLIHGGRAEEIFRDMLDEELGKKMAAAPGEGIGIAKMLYEQLSRPIVARLRTEQEGNPQGIAEPDKTDKK